MCANAEAAANCDDWRVDDEGRLLSPSGAFCARLSGDKLYLYDKRDRTERPFSLADWLRLAVVGGQDAPDW